MSNNPWPFVIVALGSLGFLANSMAQPQAADLREPGSTELAEFTSEPPEGFSRFNVSPLGSAARTSGTPNSMKLQPRTVVNSDTSATDYLESPLPDSENRFPIGNVTTTEEDTIPQTASPANSQVHSQGAILGGITSLATEENRAIDSRAPFRGFQDTHSQSNSSAPQDSRTNAFPRSNSHLGNRAMFLRGRDTALDESFQSTAPSGMDSVPSALDIPIRVAETADHRHVEVPNRHRLIRNDQTASNTVPGQTDMSQTDTTSTNTQTLPIGFSSQRPEERASFEASPRFIANRSAGPAMQATDQDRSSQEDSNLANETVKSPFKDYGDRISVDRTRDTAQSNVDLPIPSNLDSRTNDAIHEPTNASETEAYEPKLPLVPTMALFASLAANLFFGWIAWNSHSRYRELVQEMSESDSLTERRSRRARRDSPRPTSTPMARPTRSREQDEAEFLSGGLEV